MGGSFAKSLDATPSPDAPRTLHIHVDGTSQENVAYGAEGSDGPGGRGAVRGGSAPTSSKESPLLEKRRGIRGSPLVRMKHVHSKEIIVDKVVTGAGEEDKGQSSGEGGKVEEQTVHQRLNETSETCDNGETNEEEETATVEELGDTDSSIIRLTPPVVDSSEELHVPTTSGDREEDRGGREEEEEEEDEGLTTEEDETEDDELEEEEEEEEGSVSPAKEVLINIVSSR